MGNYPTWYQAAMNELDEELQLGNIDYKEYCLQEKWLQDDLDDFYERNYKEHSGTFEERY